MMKRALALLLAMLMTLFLCACGTVPTDKAEDKAENEKKYDPEMPGAIGEMVLSDEEIMELAQSDDFEMLLSKINTVADCVRYFKACQFEFYRDISSGEAFLRARKGDSTGSMRAFAVLLQGDYEEIGYITLKNTETEMCENLICVKKDGRYYAADPVMYLLPEMQSQPFMSRLGGPADADTPEALGELLAERLAEERNTVYTVTYEKEAVELYGIPIKDGLDYATVKAGLQRIIGENYSAEEIQTMADADLSLEEAAEKLSTVQDVVNYLCARGYYFDYSYNMHMLYGGYYWVWNLSAEFTFEHNAGVCGSTSNLFTRLLAGDYDSQGYVVWAAPNDGHGFKYFCIDGIYYFCDFIAQPHAPFGEESYDPINNKYSYVCCVTDDPDEFTGTYIAERDNAHDSYGAPYVTQMVYYEKDTDIVPWRGGQGTTAYFPNELRDSLHVMFLREGYSVDFAEAPPVEARPPEVNIPDDDHFDWRTGERWD